MPTSDYTASSGALKIKGAPGVTKKKKKKPKPAENAAESSSSAVITKTDQDEVSQADRSSATAKTNEQDDLQEEIRIQKSSGSIKTDAEIRFEEKRRKRLEEQLRKDGSKTHKERVEDLNRYLSKLSEHHDMPRIGPG